MIFSLGGLCSRRLFGSALVAALFGLAVPGRVVAAPAPGDAILADAADVAADAVIYDVPAAGGTATILTGSSSNVGGAAVPMDTPQFVAVSPTGAVYYIEELASGSANKIVAVSSAGVRSLVSSTALSAPTGLVWNVATGQLVVSDAGTTATNCGIYSVNPSTGVFTSLSAASGATTPKGTGAFDLPRFVAVSPAGAIYYLETGSSVTDGVYSLDSSGNRTFVGAGPTAPTGMSWDDHTGQLLISYAGVDANSSGLALVAPVGGLLTSVSGSGTAYNLPIAATAVKTGAKNYIESATNQLVAVTSAGVRSVPTLGFTPLALTGLVDVPLVAPVISSAITATGELSSAFSYAIVASNSPTSYTESGTLPNGITFDSTAGTLAGTPTQTGSFPVTLGAVNGSGTGNASLTLTVNPALSVSATSLTGLTAGSATSQTITFSGGTTPYTSVAISNFSGGGTGLLSGAVTTNVPAGTFTLSGTPTVVGSVSFTAKVTDTAGFVLSQAYSVGVSPGALNHFAVSAPGTATSGSSISVTVTAQDANNNTVTGYGGTVHFTSTDGVATLPADATLTNGTGTFFVTLQTAGAKTVTAADTVNTTRSGTSGAITVGAGAVTHLAVTAPSSATAGVASAVSVTAQDAANNTVTTYGGTVTLSSSDSLATLPAASSLVSGTKIFSVTLKTQGNQTVTANDGTLSPAVSGTVAVGAAAASSISIAATGPVTAGTSVNATVTAHDAFGNVASGYAGTIRITSSDSAAVLPANSTLSSGQGSFAVTLKTSGSKTITATDVGNGALTSTTSAITVNPAATSALVVSAPGTATAGTAISVTVTAQDQFGNVTSGYTGTVAFTSTDANAALPSNSALTNGTQTFSVTLKTAGTKTITATDTVSSLVTGTSGNVVVSPGATTKFKVTAPGTAVANSAISVGITAQDAQGNTTPGYTGTVHFTSSDGAASLPANATLTSGLGNFNVTLKTSGSQTVTATDTVTGSITGTSTGVTVGPAAATHFAVTAPSTATAGGAFSFTVTALDVGGNTATGYLGLVHFTATDSGTGLAVPANYQFLVGDNGVHTFTSGATLVTKGNQTLTATDTVTGSITGTSDPIAVSAGAVTHLAVSASTSTPVAGTAFNLTVTAQDAFSNTVAGYAGAVHFTKTDTRSGSLVPVDYTFQGSDNGTHVFNAGATLVTVGSQTITATDTVTPSINGTTSSIAVGSAAAASFVVSAPSTATAGAAISAMVTAKDAFGNTAIGYTGTVKITSSDGAAVLPSNGTLSSGTGSFAVTLKTAGSKTISATDTVNSALTGISGAITVGSGAATQLVVSTVTSTVAGSLFDLTVTAEDAAGNTAQSYLGMVHFTKTDAGAASSVPADYQFLAGDNGVHVFASGGKLVTTGSQTITATDTATGSITGTSAAIAVSPAATSNFLVQVPSSTVSGTSLSASVTARDAFGNLTPTYPGTVKITLSDGAATPPANHTLTNGVGTFSVTLQTAGSQTVTATDTVNSGVTGSASTTVAAGVASQLVISGPTTATAGGGFDFTVTAKDAAGNVASGYRGTAHFTTTDGGSATVPADYTFLVGDAGTHTFSAGAILATVGNQTLTVTDTVASALTSTTDPIAVSAGTATHFRVVAPGSASAGSAISVAISALDAFNNLVPTYSGTVHLTSGDGSAVLPADGVLSSGTANFAVTLKTAGTSTVSAVDTVSSSIAGVSAAIVVAPSAATSFTVTSSSSVDALSALTVTVTAHDAFANLATGYAGTVQLTSSDSQATLPATAALPVGTGTGTFTVTLKTAGSQTVTATDTVVGSITGTSSAITVNALTASVALSGLEQTYNGSARAIGATTTPVGLNLVFSYNSSPTPPTAAGSYPVSATISDPSYTGIGTGTLVIDKATATISLGGLTAVYDGSGKSATATTTPTGLAVSLSYVDSASHAGTPTGAGTYTVTAVITDANYSGTATGTLTIAQATQTITFNPVASASVGTPIALSATASSGLPVQFSLAGGSTATLSGSTLTLTDGNPVVVQATQSGGGNYFAATPVSQTISATKLAQTINPGNSPVTGTLATSFQLNATASSGLPVSYAVTSNNATLSGSEVTPTASGTLTIVLSQAGNAVYAAAPNVTISVSIAQVGNFVFIGSFTVTNSASVGTGLHADATLSGTIAASIDPTAKTGTIIGTVGGSGFVLAFTLAADGSFSGVTTAQTAAGSVVSGSLTFAGKLSGSTLSGTIAELQTSFSITADPVSGTSAGIAGYYQAPAVDSSSGATYSVVGTQGNVFVLSVTPTSISAGSGTLSADNTFVVTTAQSSTVTGSINAATTAVTATVTTSSGTTTSYSGLSSTTVPTDRLGNLSFLGTVSSANPMVSGFVVGGTAPKNLLLRAIGPGLTGFGLTGVLATPELKIYDSTGLVLADNTGWANSPTLSAAFLTTGAFTLGANSADAAVLLSLPTGSYSMQVTSAVAGTSGAVLAEIYDADLASAAPVQRLLNISNLGMVNAGAGSVSAGFVITGNTPKTVLIRGIGPTLVAFSVKGPLADPKLTVYNNSGTVIGLNDDWGTALTATAGQVTASTADISAADVKTGAFALPAGSKDAAVILTLAPGLYTATVTGNGGAAGTALVEVYEISR